MAEISDVECKLPQGDDCIIRVARGGDAPALIEYLNLIGGETPFLPTGANEFGQAADEEAALIARLLAAENSLYLVAVTQKRIVGILTLVGNARPRMKHVAELGVSVRKDYWQQGIGRRLMLTALAWAESCRVLHKIFLLVHHQNHHAIELYRKLGFVQEGLHTKVVCVEGVYHDCLYLARAV